MVDDRIPWRAALGLQTLLESLARVSAQSSTYAASTISYYAPPSVPTTLSSASRPSLTSSGPTVYTIAAGRGGYQYTPNKLENVNVGDIITFDFYTGDHSVARAEYGAPCYPYESSLNGRGRSDGFWSRTQYVKEDSAHTHWNYTVKTTEPIFFYCAAPTSCKDHGMVGVINPNATQTLENQLAFAKNSTVQFAPGQPIPAEASSTSSPNPSNQDHNSSGLSGGAIAGIVVGAVAFLAVCAALFFYVGRAKSLKEVLKRSPDNQPGTAGTPGDFGGPAPGSTMAHGYHSPQMQHSADYPAPMGSPLPPYQQHNATDPYPLPWGATRQLQPGEKQLSAPVELASPPSGQSNFDAAELEAPNKPADA